MKYQLTKAGPPTEALGAYSGYRIRLIAGRDAAGDECCVRVFYRGSESMPENAVPLAEHGFETEAMALEWGYDRAVGWIDRCADGEGADSVQQGDEPDPGTGHNG